MHPEGYASKGTRDGRHILVVKNITAVIRAMPILFTIVGKALF